MSYHLRTESGNAANGLGDASSFLAPLLEVGIKTGLTVGIPAIKDLMESGMSMEAAKEAQAVAIAAKQEEDAKKQKLVVGVAVGGLALVGLYLFTNRRR